MRSWACTIIIIITGLFTGSGGMGIMVMIIIIIMVMTMTISTTRCHRRRRLMDYGGAAWYVIPPFPSIYPRPINIEKK